MIARIIRPNGREFIVCTGCEVEYPVDRLHNFPFTAVRHDCTTGEFVLPEPMKAGKR